MASIVWDYVIVKVFIYGQRNPIMRLTLKKEILRGSTAYLNVNNPSPIPQANEYFQSADL